MYHSRLDPFQYCQTEIDRVQRQHVNFYSSRTDFHWETSKSLPSSWHLERAGLHKTTKSSPDELFLSVFRERKKMVAKRKNLKKNLKYHSKWVLSFIPCIVPILYERCKTFAVSFLINFKFLFCLKLS